MKTQECLYCTHPNEATAEKCQHCHSRLDGSVHPARQALQTHNNTRWLPVLAFVLSILAFMAMWRGYAMGMLGSQYLQPKAVVGPIFISLLPAVLAVVSLWLHRQRRWMSIATIGLSSLTTTAYLYALVIAYAMGFAL